MIDSALLGAASAADRIDQLAAAGTPFIFIADAWAKQWIVEELPRAISHGILWDIEGSGPLGPPLPAPERFRFHPTPPSRERYRRGFERIRRAHIAGETYLANLTYPSFLETDLSLAELARLSRAPFRLLLPGVFTVFSPECFIRIDEEGRISSYPMKGTIDAGIPHARQKILNDEKEAAEHVTIVDLIRNDLSRVASRVKVPRFRFISEVTVRDRRLLQVSSEVQGELGADWRRHTGSLLRQLLPAGSVTGAPKKRTGEIIREAEEYERGWYSGVFGVFDGRRLDSGVMIRFVERDIDGRMRYKSGGGITIYSDMESEYAELREKIYAPFG